MLTRRALIAPSPGASAPEFPAVSLCRYRQTAMATGWEITLPGIAPGQMGLVEGAFARLHEVESRLSAYREDSEVSALNRLPAGTRTPVTAELAGLLGRCLALGEMTAGALDVACGRMIKAWGFYKGPAAHPGEAVLAAMPGCNGMDKMDFDESKYFFGWSVPGVELNLGCVGKGFAVDAMAGLMSGQGGLPGGLVQCGGSSARAWGNCPGEREGWRVAVRHPWNSDGLIAEVVVVDAAIGTSAGSFRHLAHGGRRLPHVLDPRTARPAEGMASVTVLAKEALVADALSTALFVLGPEKSAGLAGLWPGVTALFMEESGKITVVGEHAARFHVCSV